MLCQTHHPKAHYWRIHLEKFIICQRCGTEKCALVSTRGSCNESASICGRWVSQGYSWRFLFEIVSIVWIVSDFRLFQADFKKIWNQDHVGPWKVEFQSISRLGVWGQVCSTCIYTVQDSVGSGSWMFLHGQRELLYIHQNTTIFS